MEEITIPLIKKDDNLLVAKFVITAKYRKNYNVEYYNYVKSKETALWQNRGAVSFLFRLH